jgi:hypothetical protein
LYRFVYLLIKICRTLRLFSAFAPLLAHLKHDPEGNLRDGMCEAIEAFGSWSQCRCVQSLW